jgi:hypothetical protein
MKVNPSGIQAYQSLIRPDRPAGGTGQTGRDTVVIEPQATDAKSSLSVKAPSGSFADTLSVEERQALDMLFAKFSDTKRFGASYASETEATASRAGVGNMIDIRV